MKFGVVVFPGSNCDDDMLHVLGDRQSQQEVKMSCGIKINTLARFWPCKDCIILPGGFSYRRLPPCRSHCPLFTTHAMPSLTLPNNGGYVWGICNGFQILCESGLLPGVLLRNSQQKFVCKNVYLKTTSKHSPVTAQLKEGSVLKIPIAHADGRYQADAASLQRLNDNQQILFKYCDSSGNVSEDANPNGSLQNIAGICNEGRNVFGMMPHPERASEAVLGNTDGKFLFESLINSVPSLV